MTVPTPPSSSPDPDRSGPSRPRDGSRSGSGANAEPGLPGAHRQDHLPARPGEAGHGSGSEAAGPPRVRQEVRDGALCALAVAVLGVALGLLWVWLAPRVPMFTVDNSVFLKDPEGEEAVGADGTFVLLALGFGAVTGTLAFLRSRSGGVGLVVGLAAGALLGSVLAWRLGVQLGPETDLAAAAKAAGAGKTFDGPLKLQAKGALLAWPLAAVLVHLGLVGLFGKREPEPEEPASPWGGGTGTGAPQNW